MSDERARIVAAIRHRATTTETLADRTYLLSRYAHLRQLADWLTKLADDIEQGVL